MSWLALACAGAVAVKAANDGQPGASLVTSMALGIVAHNFNQIKRKSNGQAITS